MGNLKGLKDKFENAQRALLQILFDSDEDQSNPVYVQMALDRMSQAFHALLIHALDAPEQVSPHQEQEILCAHAINQGNECSGSNWRVAFVNGNLIPEAERISVSDFTQKMLTDGWKTVSPSGCPSTLRAPDGEIVALLYFSRKCTSSETAWIFKPIHSQNSMINHSN